MTYAYPVGYNKVMLFGGYTSIFGRNSFSKTIKFFSLFRKSAYTSTAILSLLVLAILCPLYLVPDSSEATAGTATESTLTFAFVDDKNTASVSLDVSSTSGSFATSTSEELAEFSLTTNNATGYTLNLRTSGSETTLVSGANTISAINGSKLSSEFVVNTWGLLPSKYNSAANTTNYYPASNAGFTMDTTSAANTTANTYTVGLGVKVDFTIPAGTYTNSTIIAEYVANPVNYSITYDKGNLTGTPSNIPAIQSGQISVTSITLSGTSPSITGYNFTGWCLGTITTTDDVDNCSGNTFQPSGSFGIDQTINNTATLHAMWSIKTYVLTVQNGGNTTVSGSGTYKYGQTVTISATPTSNTTCTTYGTPSWAKTDGVGTLNATSGTSATFTMGDGTATVKATSSSTNVKQTISLSRTGGAAGITIGGSSYTGSSVQLNCGTYNISGTYDANYEFSSWAVSGSVSLGSSTATASNSITVSGTGTLTLTGKASCSTITFKTSNASSINLNGTDYSNNSSACIANGTYWVYGNYATKYAFKSWANTAGNFANSSYQVTQYTVSGNATITLTGQFVTTTIQSITSSTCTTTAKPVYDSRDNEVYWIQQLADGKCWMLDNLRLGSTSTIALTSSDTNTDTNWTLPASGTVCFATSSCTGTDGITTGTGYTVPAIYTTSKNNIPKYREDLKVYGPGTGKIGVYYNFCAASVGTICVEDSTSGKAYYDVCPANWKMPIEATNTAGSYYYLYTTTYSADDTNFRNALSTPLSGRIYDGIAREQGTVGHFWTATRSNSNGMYQIQLNLSSTTTHYGFPRINGGSIRCILIG